MKKILIFICFVVFSTIQAQDLPYLMSLNKITTDKEAIKITDDIASLQTKKLRLLKAQEFPEDHVLMVRYVPEEMTNEQYDKLELGYQNAFLTVTFNIDFVGQNKDLEQAGVKTYKFKKLKGTYLQLFPVWKKYYRQDAELEKTLTNSKLQTFIDYPKKLDFYIQDDNEEWIIYNQSRI